MKVRVILFLSLLGSLLSLDINAQISIDSNLLDQPYDSIISLYNENKKDTFTAVLIARTYLKKE